MTYDLLGRVASTACGAPEYVKEYVNRSADKWPGNYRYLYESAKVQALDMKADADLLLYVRAVEKIKDGQYCVTVSGLAARLATLRATAGNGAAVPKPEKRGLLPLGD